MMNTANLIPVSQFCTHYEVEYTFIESLSEFGLVEIITIEEDSFIPQEIMPDLEKMVRLYLDLNLNVEGIDVVNHLLHKIASMQEEIKDLRNKLSLYEDI